VHDTFYIFLADGVKIVLLRKVLADKAIGVLVSSSLPRGIGMRKMDICTKVASDAFMIGELLAVISCDRVRSHRKRLCDKMPPCLCA